MSKRGWSLNTLQHPPCLHLCVTTCHEGKAKEFLEDLEASNEEASASAGKVPCLAYLLLALNCIYIRTILLRIKSKPVWAVFIFLNHHGCWPDNT